MREIYVYLDLVTPCKFWDDSYRQFEEYVSEKLDKIDILSEEYEGITFSVPEITCDNSNAITVTLQVSEVYGGFRDGSNEFEEDNFIKEYTPVVKGYLENTLLPQINAALSNDRILGTLPNAYIIFVDERIFVQIDYGQTAIEFDYYPAEVEFNADVEQLVSDLYFTEES